MSRMYVTHYHPFEDDVFYVEADELLCLYLHENWDVIREDKFYDVKLKLLHSFM